MQKIMMLAKLWCQHAEGFESGLKAWELDVGEWERASGTVLADAVRVLSDDEYGTDFLRNSLQLGKHANSAALRTALLQWCYSSQNFGATLTVSAGNGTGADDDNRMQVDSLKKGKWKGKGTHQNQRSSHKTRRMSIRQLTPQHKPGQEQQERQSQRHTVGRGANESSSPPATAPTLSYRQCPLLANSSSGQFLFWPICSSFGQSPLLAKLLFANFSFRQWGGVGWMVRGWVGGSVGGGVGAPPPPGSPLHPGPPFYLDPSAGSHLPPDRPKCRFVFPVSRSHFRFFFSLSLSGVFFVEFWWCL